MKLLANKIFAILNSILPNSENRSLHEPCFQGNEWNYVKDCIDTGWVSSVGKYVDRFEIMLADYTGVARAVAVVNGTAALQVALKLVDVDREDEVLLPTLTFVATANAVSYLGAIPHFVDSEERTLGLDPKKLLSYLQEIGTIRGGECFNRFTGHRIKAVVPMHTFGHPVDLDPLVELCKNFHLVLVEDAAESLGSYYKGKHTGNLGKVSILSFNGNKTITTGGGGAILTNNKELGKFAKHLTTTAKIPHRWEYQHDNIGFNFRLPNINAAIGCAQMEQLDNFINKKRALAERYQDAFKNFDGIKVFKEASFAQSNYWLNVLLFNEIYADQREDLLELTNNNNIMTRPSWTPIHKLTMYKDCPRMDLSVAESLEKRIVNIPSSVIL